jgi:predicted lipid-binding transport protein (Tim44 family)
MKKSLLALMAAAVTFAGLGFNASDAEAKRLGGGGSFGMQRSAPAPTQQAVPPKPAAPAAATNPATAAAPAAAAQAGKRSWLGPIAGLAAGLGIAALLSHFGLGEEVASFLMIALLVFAAIFVIRLLLRKNTPPAAMKYAGAGAGAPRAEPLQFEAAGQTSGGTTSKVGAGGTASGADIPADFDVEGFLRQAKLNFLRLQAANDRGDMDDIKSFTAPEVFAEVQMQYEERGHAAQQTDIVQFDAHLLEVVTENNLHVASVRFHGQLREESAAAPAAFDEVWHLVKPIDGSRGWMIAGIQQVA